MFGLSLVLFSLVIQGTAAFNKRISRPAADSARRQDVGMLEDRVRVKFLIVEWATHAGEEVVIRYGSIRFSPEDLYALPW